LIRAHVKKEHGLKGGNKTRKEWVDDFRAGVKKEKRDGIKSCYTKQ
jgi:hypothetical protein